MANPKPLILFDIDKTMIDREQLRILQRRTLAEALNCTEDEVANAFVEYYGGIDKTSDFNPDNFLSFLAKKFQFSLKKLTDIFFQPANFQQVLYGDVVEVLSKLRNQDYPLGIYSQGNRRFQEHKLLANNLMKFFDKNHRYISEAKMDPEIIADLPANTIIIDDAPAVIAFLEKFPNVIPLHMVRDAEEKPTGKNTLSGLSDLLPLLDSLGDA